MFAVVISQLRYHAQIFVCVVTRLTTAEVQHNDMMKTNVQNDLRHEMALEMWIVSVHEKSETTVIQLRETENKACMCIDLYF